MSITQISNNSNCNGIFWKSITKKKIAAEVSGNTCLSQRHATISKGWKQCVKDWWDFQVKIHLLSLRPVLWNLGLKPKIWHPL